jgi:hypothetical protein
MGDTSDHGEYPRNAADCQTGDVDPIRESVKRPLDVGTGVLPKSTRVLANSASPCEESREASRKRTSQTIGSGNSG